MKEKDQVLNKLEAEFKAQRFVDQLVSLIKRINPENYASRVSSIIFQIIDDQNQWARNPIHTLLNSIEVNCAYSGYFSNEDLSEQKYNRILQHYSKYDDPYLKYLLQEKQNTHLFYLAIAKQQFWSQRKPNNFDIARMLNLFFFDNSLPNTSKLFQQETNISILDWIYLNYAVLTDTITHHSPVINENSYIDSEVKSLPKESVKPFFAASSLTIEGVRNRYLELHRNISPLDNIIIPSVFSEKPFIKISENTYIVPHPYFPIIHATDGLYRMCYQVDPAVFLPEFSKSFENYVGKILSEMPGIINFLSEKEIQKVSYGRTSDYLLEFQDCILLVECKGVRYNSLRFTANAIEKDNSTGKIADAYSQIIETANRIIHKELEKILSDSTKPLLGLCVIFGEIFLLNAPSFFNDYIYKRMRLVDYDFEKWPSPLIIAPQTVSIDTLEKMVMTLRSDHITIKDLILKKTTLPYERVGDWDAYLHNNEFIDPTNWSLEIAEKTINWFNSYILGDKD